ncbi:MAG TPA: sorbosone dehydrogenase family protein [Bacteroidetes bacterium]|nr:sorbosone dehydrogenase family protein [Bacteroidota bacterium]
MFQGFPFYISRRVYLPGLVYLLLATTLCTPPSHAQKRGQLSHIQLPPGFVIDIYADKVPNARSLALGEQGTVFVGTRSGNGCVYAVVDADGDFHADKVYTLACEMNSPNGVAFRNGSLFVAEVNRVVRWDNIESKLKNPGKPALVTEQLPNDQHHGWKYLAFGPDDKLYLPVGAPCNICERLDDRRYASIMRMNADGSELEVFASGIRNSVGFAFHPSSKELWFTDNGRDWLGDNLPPDELNRAAKAGLHFGYPYCHAGDVPDPEFGQDNACADYVPPVQKLGAHVAALGMLFYQGNMFPAVYRDKILIAEHGSWNRPDPLGYRITAVSLEDNRATDYSVFAEGWRHNGEVWGRPVDLLELPDGSLLVSDDYAGKIYRISYKQ